MTPKKSKKNWGEDSEYIYIWKIVSFFFPLIFLEMDIVIYDFYVSIWGTHTGDVCGWPCRHDFHLMWMPFF